MLSYRIVIFALLAAITYYFTGNAGQTTVISIVFNVLGSAVYYGYERLWDVIQWGRPASPLPPTRMAVAPIGAAAAKGLSSVKPES